MGERTVLASFYSQEEAKKAADEIKQMGIEVTQVDELTAYPGGSDREAYIISGRIPGLSSLTLHSDPDSRDTGILMAADPSAYSMSDGEDNITGRNWLLTVVCPEDHVQSVVQTIKQCNGYT